MKWLSIEYWKYLLRPADRKNYASFWTRLKCRYKQHPAGVWWYNPNGTKPDLSCKTCGDLLE